MRAFLRGQKRPVRRKSRIWKQQRVHIFIFFNRKKLHHGLSSTAGSRVVFADTDGHGFPEEIVSCVLDCRDARAASSYCSAQLFGTRFHCALWSGIPVRDGRDDVFAVE